ncbi:hypothetical protein BJ875DRAFT_455792 [Amylocarpus encephaloides]|uniref:Uncharacterized protein n=1 Tax=Amylocarpus encephaloides TaxID=45428 RepID=A0A9P8C7E9_9HELO|nr:hypothetical protein BJ875DRAFT_455792 [Amylocarpus encephaloides]
MNTVNDENEAFCSSKGDMSGESHGRPAEPAQKAMNGKTVNGRAISTNSTAPAQKRRKGGFSIFSRISRLLTWYSIITILFQCPSTDRLTDESPRICKPYFQLKATVTPYLEPYYIAYAASYVDTARPYYETADQWVFTPAVKLAKQYGAPRVAQAQKYGQAQWEKNLQPQVSKYQGIAKDKYDETLGPHVNKAVEGAAPYYDMVKTNALQTYYGHLLPTYHTVQPYAVEGYIVLSDFAVNTVLPYSKWAWATGAVFLDRTVWPRVRILYGENVEPQLVRIGERLGRYRDGKKLKAVVDEAGSTSLSVAYHDASTATTSTETVESTAAPAAAASSSTSDQVVESTPESAPKSVEEIRTKAQEVVANDLKTWQEKFAKAADEGSDELEERLTEVTKKLIETQAHGVGNALIVELEESARSGFETLKTNIISIVKNNEDIEESEEDLNTAVRKIGIAVKEKAQAVRNWKQNFDQETNSLVEQAASDTFEILDYIRDLGLQEIGMRWAWTDGITHKDWTKYHKLKGKFDEWRVDVERVVIEHPGLSDTRAASEDVESRAMDIAEEAAKELARLKETGRWKLSTDDTSDDFSTKRMPAAAAAVGKKAKKKLSEAVGSSQGTVESVASVASSSIKEAVSTVSASIVGTFQGTVSSAISAKSSIASSLASEASGAVVGTQQGSAESVASIIKGSAESLVDQASSSIIGSSVGTVEGIASAASESASSISAKASSSVAGGEPSIVEQASDSVKSAASVISDSASSLAGAASPSISSGSSHVSEVVSGASSSLSSATSSIAESLSSSASDASISGNSAASSVFSTASKKVWGGAMAARVEAREIVYDDIVDDSSEDTFSENVQSMASEAGDKYAEITKAVSEALLKPSSTPGYQVTELASQQYSSALAAASSALYGTEQGAGETLVSVASSRYVEAVSAARAIIYGTPVPILDSAATQASKAYSNAISRASEQYSLARSIVSAQISGKPKPVHEEMFSSVEAAYSDSVAAASSKLQAAASLASSAVYGAPSGALESATSVAQSRLSEGLDAASSRYQQAKDYVAAVNTRAPQKQKMLMQMQEQYYAGIGMAHARYSEFIEAASSAVMPKPTPFHESLYTKASAGVVGASTHGFKEAMSTAEASYSRAISEASNELNKLISSVSAIGGAHKDVVPTSSLAAMASSRYSAAVSKASKSYASVSSVVADKVRAGASRASTPVYGSETPLTESVASVASENWEALITKASEQIYGATTPYFVTRQLLSEAKEYGSQVTDAASSQYFVVQSIISELVVGKEPAFTDSVHNKLSSAYYTRAEVAASTASSYASEVFASASSVVGAVFTPPPTIEIILNLASSRVNDAVEAASIQFYGTTTGAFAEASSSASSAYSSVQSVVSEKIYGSNTRYAEAASVSISDAAVSAQKAISEAIYGTPTGTYSSATSAAGDAYSSAQAKISSAIYGEEQGAAESAQARLSTAVESARVRLAEFAASVGEGASGIVKQASEGVEEFASSVSSAVESATSIVKDEL